MQKVDELIIRDVVEEDAAQLVFLLSQMKYEMSVEKMRERINAFRVVNHFLKVAAIKDKIVGLIAFICY